MLPKRTTMVLEVFVTLITLLILEENGA